MAVKEKIINVEERFLYIKCSKNVTFKKFGKPVTTIPGGAVYRICAPAIMDCLVDNTLTIEHDSQDNVEVIQSEFALESLPMNSSASGASPAPVVDLTALETSTDSIALTNEAIKASLADTDTTISEIATELSAFHADFNRNGNGEGGTPPSMIPTNEKLEKIIGGLNQLQKISINVPKKFDTALLTSDSSSIKIVAFDTLLPQDVNLYYTNTPIKASVGSNTVSIHFLGGIYPQGTFNVKCGVNSETAITEAVGNTEGDILTFNAGKQVTSIEWISLVGINT